MMARFDTNGDGLISKAENRAMVEAIVACTPRAASICSCQSVSTRTEVGQPITVRSCRSHSDCSSSEGDSV